MLSPTSICGMPTTANSLLTILTWLWIALVQALAIWANGSTSSLKTEKTPTGITSWCWSPEHTSNTKKQHLTSRTRVNSSLANVWLLQSQGMMKTLILLYSARTAASSSTRNGTRLIRNASILLCQLVGFTRGWRMVPNLCAWSAAIQPGTSIGIRWLSTTCCTKMNSSELSAIRRFAWSRTWAERSKDWRWSRRRKPISRSYPSQSPTTKMASKFLSSTLMLLRTTSPLVASKVKSEWSSISFHSLTPLKNYSANCLYHRSAPNSYPKHWPPLLLRSSMMVLRPGQFDSATISWE